MSLFEPKALAGGERVYLCAPHRRARPEYLDFLKRNETYHRPWVYHSGEVKYYDHYLKRIRMGITQGCFVREWENDRLMGVININNIMYEPLSSASLGYYGDAACAGKGMMGEAMGLVLGYALDVLGLHRLEANIQPENISSIKYVKNQGFVKEGFSRKYMKINGEWRDHERWAILL